MKKMQWNRLISREKEALHLDIAYAISDTKLPERLIVVDPSLIDLHGHSADYAFFAAHNFKEHFVLANKAATQAINPKLNLIKTFSTDIWGNRHATQMTNPKESFRRNAKIDGIKSIYRSLKRNCFFRYAYYFLLRLAPALFRKIISVVVFALVPEIFSVFSRGLKTWIEEFAPLERLPVWLITVLSFHYRRYVRDAKVGLEKSNLRKGDLVFFHMITRENILGTITLLEEIFKKTETIPVILLRYPAYLTFPSKDWRLLLGLRKLEYYAEKGIVRIASDSHLLIEEYSTSTSVPFELFPIPHGKITLPKAIGDKLCVTTLGNARAEKGFVEICHVLDLINESQIRDKIRFVIQCNNSDIDSQEFVSEIKRKSYDFPVHFIEEAIPEVTYNQYLNEADIILAPYHQEIYSARTSGIALESLVLGKVLITTENTWMSSQVALFGSGIVIKDKNIISLLRSLEKVVEEYLNFRKRAEESSVQVAKVHNLRNFYDCLVGRTRLRIHENRQVLFHYPWDDLFALQGGASLRSSLFVRALSEKNWFVNVCARLDSVSVRQIPKNVNLFNIKEATASFGLNDFYFFNFTLRLFSNSWKISQAEEFQYLFRYWCRKRSTKRLLNTVVRKSKAIILEYPFVTEIFRFWSHAYNIPLVVDNHDVLSKQLTGKNDTLQAELRGMSNVDLAVSVSLEDHQFFKNHGVDTIIISQPVDLQNIRNLDGLSARNILKHEGIRVPEKFGFFVGSNFGPNLVAVQNLLKLSKHPLLIRENIALVTAGKCQLNTQESGSYFIELGAVSKEALQALYSLASFVIIPLETGTGASLKTVEAFAYQKIVIGTDIAFRGLNVESGIHCLIVKDLNQMPALIVNVLKDQLLMMKLRFAAYKLVEERDYNTVFQPVLDFLN